MKKHRDVSLYVEDMMQAIHLIYEYIEGKDRNDIEINDQLHDSILYRLGIVGEASTHLTQDIKQKFNTVDWRDIKDFRNFLIHEYFEVNTKKIWNVIKKDLPILLKVIKEITEYLKEKAA